MQLSVLIVDMVLSCHSCSHSTHPNQSITRPPTPPNSLSPTRSALEHSVTAYHGLFVVSFLLSVNLTILIRTKDPIEYKRQTPPLEHHSSSKPDIIHILSITVTKQNPRNAVATTRKSHSALETQVSLLACIHGPGVTFG